MLHAQHQPTTLKTSPKKEAVEKNDLMEASIGLLLYVDESKDSSV
jgi:hypothetical protein